MLEIAILLDLVDEVVVVKAEALVFLAQKMVHMLLVVVVVVVHNNQPPVVPASLSSVIKSYPSQQPQKQLVV